ncbi:MAG TPA: polysaccharide deacetylase family protein, partial [Pyrinomonadaceae bacterium]|nr:polysaccharide deacetylase family protein [Pyrinomonadaceae bacterium]
NFLTMAAPRLAARDLPASVFLITDWVRPEGDGAPSRAWAEDDDARGMTWAEINELRSRGVEFGSHTCTHPRLPELADDEAERELIRSRSLIAEHLDGGGTEGTALPFAYPYGAYTPALVERARRAGYSCALTTDAGANDADTDLYELRRVLVGDGDDEASFAARVSGLTAWLGRGLGAARGAGY